MVKAYCIINDDMSTRYEWPTDFVILPEVGHYIRSKCGKRELIVKTITHVNSAGYKPAIYLTLNKR